MYVLLEFVLLEYFSEAGRCSASNYKMIFILVLYYIVCMLIIWFNDITICVLIFKLRCNTWIMVKKDFS